MIQPKFGKAPGGERLELIKKSAHFKNGKFHNILFTPIFTKGYSMLGVLYNQVFKTHPGKYPNVVIPSTKTDLLQLHPDENILVWFGHSSYFVQIEGKRFLVDPVFSGNASPIPGSIKAFKGTDRYTVADLPEIDYLLISHDHYDHLDYTTIVALKHKIKTVICGLGVGSHFEYWGYSPNKIIEKEWNETLTFDNGLKIHATPARHFSGRAFSRNNTLWLSYVVETPKRKLYVGGDSGYGTHFAEIGKKHGPFDLVILENGQYNDAWVATHLFPEQVLKAAADLSAKRLFPVHSSKFALAMHPWDEPLTEVAKWSKIYQIPLVSPIIGEKVLLDNGRMDFSEWWKEIKI